MASRNEKIIILTKALSHEKRLQIYHWLKNPTRHFSQLITTRHGISGVPTGVIAKKLGVREPTASVHLKLLERAGLVKSTRAGSWTIYRRIPESIDRAKQLISKLD